MKWVRAEYLFPTICTKKEHLCWQLASAVRPKRNGSNVCYSRKYDGIRIEVNTQGVLLSRNGYILPSDLLPKWAKRCKYNLDGELVTHKDSTHTKVIKALHRGDYEYLKLMVFDVKVPDVPFSERLELLAKCVPKANRVQQKKIVNDSTISDAMAECETKGYEGIVVRSLQAPYTCGRQSNKVMYKIKVKK